MKDMDEVLEDLRAEVDAALSNFGDFRSAHEGYAVILEELDELWIEVKKNQQIRDPEKLKKEALQVAAMAVKFVMFIEEYGEKI